MIAADPRQRFPFGAAILFLVGLGALSCSITLLFLGMRAVMDVGGACADGGPYVSAQPCPDNVAWFMIGGIWGGFIAAAVAFVGAAKLARGYGMIVLLAWPALFLALGWNFLEYGLDPPGPGGVEAGFLVCAVVFAIMAVGPLLVVSRNPWSLVRLFWPKDDPLREGRTMQRFGLPTLGRPTGRPVDARPFAARAPSVRRGREPERRPSPTPERKPEPEAVDVVDRLERLARLHREGALDDAEYDAAKRAVLEDAG